MLKTLRFTGYAMLFLVNAAVALFVVLLATHVIGIDWYPSMGVHAVHMIAFHHFISLGWVQQSPGHVAFKYFNDVYGGN